MPERSTAEMCTNTSLDPSSGWINPYPFWPLNHFTVPIVIVVLWNLSNNRLRDHSRRRAEHTGFAECRSGAREEQEEKQAEPHRSTALRWESTAVLQGTSPALKNSVGGKRFAHALPAGLPLEGQNRAGSANGTALCAATSHLGFRRTNASAGSLRQGRT